MTRLLECTGATLAGIALGYHLRHIDRAMRAVEAAVEHHHAARAQAIAAASKPAKEKS